MYLYIAWRVLPAVIAFSLPIGTSALAQSTAQTNSEASLKDALATRIDAYMRAAVAHDQFSGSILVARDGIPIVDTAYGMSSYELSVPNTPRTVFHVASITKQFTAMAIMQLRDRGKLNVGDPICNYLADCPDTWKPITIRHLLTQTSGIKNVSSLPEWDNDLSLKHYSRAEFIDLFRALPIEFVPGQKYSYSNSGYQLLALIIERLSGSSYEQFVKANIFAPLGMANSGFDDNRVVISGAATGYYSRGTAFITATYVDPTTNYGDGGMVSTTGDLLRWDQALYTQKLVSSRSLQEVFTPYKNGYGYGWEIGTRFGKMTVGHSGSNAGFSSYILRFPDDQLTVIVLGNSDRMSAGKTAINLSAIVLGEPDKMPTSQLRDELWDTMTRGGVAAATARFDRVRQETPTRTDANGDTLLEVGYDLIAVRRLSEADAIFRFGLLRFPNLAYAWDGLADVAIARDDPATALSYFRRSLKLDPTNDYAVKGIAKLRGKAKLPMRQP